MNKIIIFIPILLAMVIFAVHSADNFECPKDDGDDLVAAHFPHHNCSLFYICDHGIPTEQECPDGLHFNPVLEVCDYPAVAGCTGLKGRKFNIDVKFTFSRG